MNDVRMNVAFRDYATNSIFSKFQQNGNFIWGEPFNEQVASLLDAELVENYGERIVSNRVYRLLNTENLISSEDLTILVNTIALLYKNSLEHKYALLKLEYDPIANYDRIETTTISDDYVNTSENTDTTTNDLTDTRTDNLQSNTTIDENDTRTDDLTQQSNGSGNNQVYGFNSDSGVNSDSNTDTENITNTGTQKTDRTGSNNTSNTGTQEIKKTGTISNTGNKTDTNKGSRTTDSHITGNIGVTTSQQMMESELEFWKWSFYQNVVEIFKEYLSLPIYDYDLY